MNWDTTHTDYVQLHHDDYVLRNYEIVSGDECAVAGGVRSVAASVSLRCHVLVSTISQSDGCIS